MSHPNPSITKLMKPLFLAFFSVFMTLSAFSQNENPIRNASLKIYNLTTVDRIYTRQLSDSTDNPDSNTNYDIQLLHPTFAYQWLNAKGNGHEIELTSFRMTASESNKWSQYAQNPSSLTPAPYAQSSAVISLRYEYILFLKRGGEPKLVPAMGFGFNPYYMVDIYTPTISTAFPEIFQAVGARFFAIPRLNYSISDRVYLDLNFPVSIHDFKFVTARNEDPGIPISERKTTTIDTESFAPVFSARIGVGIRL